MRRIQLQNARTPIGRVTAGVRVRPGMNISPATGTKPRVVITKLLAGVLMFTPGRPMTIRVTFLDPGTLIEKVTRGGNGRSHQATASSPSGHLHLLNLVINIARGRLTTRIIRVINHELVGPPPTLLDLIPNQTTLDTGFQDAGDPAGYILVTVADGLSVPDLQ